jgi:hypothetical protein
LPLKKILEDSIQLFISQNTFHFLLSTWVGRLCIHGL